MESSRGSGNHGNDRWRSLAVAVVLFFSIIPVNGHSAESNKEKAYRLYNERCVPVSLEHDWQQTVVECTAVVELHPIMAAIFKVAFAYERLRDWTNSIEWYNKALQVCPPKMRGKVIEKIELLKEVKKNGGKYPEKKQEEVKQ